MSTATAKPAPPSAAADQSDRDRGDRLIAEHLEAARGALWRSAILRAILQIGGVLLAACLAFVVVDQWIWSFSTMARVVLFLCLGAAALAWIAMRVVPLLRLRVSAEYAAYSLEHDSPELRHALSSYVTLRTDRDAPGLRGIVVRSIGVRAARHLSATGMAMPTEAGGTFKTAMVVVAIFAMLAIYAAVSPKNTLQSFGRLMMPLARIAPPTRVHISEVTPGSTETLFGRPLDVEAKIYGLLANDPLRILVDGERPAEVDLEPAGGPGRFSGQIPASLVNHSFQYSIVAGDTSRGPFDVVVRDEPTLMIQSVQYVPHPYTQLPQRTSSTGAIDGVEGTRVTVIATSNRTVKRGHVEFNPRVTGGRTTATGGRAPLDIADDGRTVSATWNLRSGLRSSGDVAMDSYRLRIWDDTDTPNADPIEYPIRVQPDLAPEIHIAVPSQWPKEVPLGSQQLIEIRALDPDFGLRSVQLQIRRGSRSIATPMLIQSDEGLRGNQVALYRFRPDELGLRAGDIATLRAIATDNRTTIEGDQPDPNETASDPVELRIIEAPPRGEATEDGDGLGPKDDEPAAGDTQEPAKEETDDQQTPSAEEQSGEGQAGEEQSGEEQSGEGQTGEGQSGEGQSGEGQSGGSETGEGEAGEGQAGQGQAGEGQAGEGQAGEGQAGEGQAGEGQAGEGQAGEGQAGEGQAGQGQAGEGQPGAGSREPEGSAQDQSPAGNEAPAAQQDSEQPAGPGDSTPPPPGEQPADRSAEGDPQPTIGDGGASADSPADAPSKAPASSDGEAFERIRDYLQEQKQEAESSSGAGPQRDESAQSSGNGPDQQREAGGQSEETGVGDAAAPPTDGRDGTDGDEQGSEKQPTGTGEAASGEDRAAATASEANEGGTTEEGTTEEGTAEDGTAEEGAGERGSPEEGAGEDSAGGDEDAERRGEGEAGDASSQGDAPPGEAGEPGDSGDPGDAGDDASGSTSGNSADGSAQQASPEQSPDADPRPSEPPSGSPAGDPSGGFSGNQAAGQSGAAEAPPAPDPVNPEHAREATDLVLDELQNQRDAIDPELLDQLGWTPDQLKRFIDRWEKARRMAESGDPSSRDQFDESLRSLGIRPPQTPRTRTLDSRSDQLENLRDTGNRVPPPPQFRDAFEAFRRSVNQP